MDRVESLSATGRYAVDVRVNAGDLVAVVPEELEAARGARGWWCGILRAGHKVYPFWSGPRDVVSIAGANFCALSFALD